MLVNEKVKVNQVQVQKIDGWETICNIWQGHKGTPDPYHSTTNSFISGLLRFFRICIHKQILKAYPMNIRYISFDFNQLKSKVDKDQIMNTTWHLMEQVPIEDS